MARAPAARRSRRPPRLSLCIVARDEASFIGDAIASASAVVDEVVVVDTGSSDGTPAIARAEGARVVEAEWAGDLGKAHDLPVAHARGDWVLALDADEVLDPGARDRLRELIACGERDAYEVPVRNYQYDLPYPKWRAADPRDPLTRGAIGYVAGAAIRLFRRRPEYVYSGRVHQTLKPAILRSGGVIGAADVPIHHYGHLRFDRHKSHLYLRLARYQVEDTPTDPRAWIDFGILLSVGQLPAAVDAFRRARSLGDRAAAPFQLGSALFELGQPSASIPLLEEAIRNNADDGSPFYERADAWEALGLAYEALNRAQDAAEAYAEALRLRPDSPAAACNLAALLIDDGAAAAAERLLHGVLRRYRGSDTPWSLLGLLEFRRGNLDAAQRLLETAAEICPPKVVSLLNLAEVYARRGRPRKAARLYSHVAERRGSAEARRLDLGRRIPARYRRAVARPLRDYGDDLVVSMISALGGGAGRVLVDGVKALEERPHLVLCQNKFPYVGQGLLEELATAGVDVLTVNSDDAVRTILARVRPRIVLHHDGWIKEPLLPGADRVGDERWICISHGGQPMPLGYDAYVVVSEFQRRFQGHLPTRVDVIPNGVSLERFARPANRPDGAPVTIAMLSRLVPGKFPRRLLEYLPALDEGRVLIAGWGGRRYELEPEIAERGLGDRVRFVGPISSAETPRFLARADIGLHLTELAEESCSMAILEMLAAGLPIVAEPKGGVPEMIVADENGFLASAPADIADRVQRLIASEELRRSMGEASRRMARRFDMARFRSSLRRLVAEVERKDVASAGAGAASARAVASLPARSRRPWRPRLSVVLCATPRSGSNLLGETLASTGVAGRPGEFFLASAIRTLAPFWGVDDLESYVAELFEWTSTPNGVFATKLMPDDLPPLVVGLAAPAGLSRPAPAIFRATFPNPRYVWIRRRDRLRQAISWERARQTGVWADWGEPLPFRPLRPRFDAAAIGARLRELERGERFWERFFAAVGALPVQVFYEELERDCEAASRRVLRELGIDIPPDLVFAPGRLRKQRDALTERWVERFVRSRGRLPRAA